MEQLFIRLVEQNEGQLTAQWALFRGSDKVAGSYELRLITTLASVIPSATSARHIVIIIPSQHILLSGVNVLLTQKRHLQKILPFLIEDKLAEPLTALHITAGKMDGQGNLPVAVVKNSLMQHWLSALSDIGIMPHELICETSLLKGNWELLVDSRMAWLRVNACESYTIERNMLPDLMELLSNTHSVAPVIECITSDAVPMQLPGYELRIKSAQSVLDIFCDAYLTETASPRLNLLQGEFCTRAQSSTPAWKMLARIAAVWCIGMMLVTGAEAAWLFYKTNELREQSVALYRQLFPADSKVINPRIQMESHITGSAATKMGFLPLLQKIAACWPTGDNVSLQIQNLSYREVEGVLILSVTGSSIDSVTKLAEKLNSNGLNAKMQSVVNGNGNVTGQLLVKMEGR